MGYYTYFMLTTIGEQTDIEKFEKDLSKISNNEDVDYLIENQTVYAKLYELSDWIREAAKKNPNVLIILTGDGEESDDNWEERYKGENFERQMAIIPPFENPNLRLPSELNSSNK